MTSEEILQVLKHLRGLGLKGDPSIGNLLPLWEIAYQLAVGNEQRRNLNVLELERFAKNHGLVSRAKAAASTEPSQPSPHSAGSEPFGETSAQTQEKP
jgi:hypothetical protein